jgi:hypothetical protein
MVSPMAVVMVVAVVMMAVVAMMPVMAVVTMVAVMAMAAVVATVTVPAAMLADGRGARGAKAERQTGRDGDGQDQPFERVHRILQRLLWVY